MVTITDKYLQLLPIDAVRVVFKHEAYRLFDGYNSEASETKYFIHDLNEDEVHTIDIHVFAELTARYITKVPANYLTEFIEESIKKA